MGKQFSKWTLIRLLQLHLFTWLRVGKSLESQRDEIMFQFFKQELALLRQEQRAEKIRLWYYDESGFNLNLTAMYAWLPAKQTLKLPAQRGNILTVAGFLSDDNTLQAYAYQGSTTSQHFIKYVDDFIKQYPPKMKTIIHVDNDWASPPPSINQPKLKKSLENGDPKIYSCNFYLFIPQS